MPVPEALSVQTPQKTNTVAATAAKTVVVVRVRIPVPPIGIAT
ncbi:hypothetical protein [Streptodolium elevatio]